ncbi:MAG: HlyD family efflux transporter periplasmic adaptor subunit [Burkholderiales bacterium]|nr:MAG: HlyD family efflux transporter periplasmic adaptor subunit [Burkholderiales bacterium]
MSVIAKFRRGRAEESAKASAAAEDPPALSGMDRAVRPRRITAGRVAIGVGVLLILAVGVFGYVRYGTQRTLAVSAERVTISTVEQAAFRDYVPVTGAIAPEDTVFLDTVEGGQVTEVLVEDGAVVEAGQPLARLKNTRLELEVLGREAQLTEQQNFLANARLAFQQSELRNQRDMMNVEREIARINDTLIRQKPLEEQGGVSRAVIVNLETDLAYRTAEGKSIEQSQLAEREVARRNLSQLESSIGRMAQSLILVRENLDNLTVTAPIAGQLTGFELKVGEVIGAGQRLGQIDSVDSYKIAVLVDEFYLGRIAFGQNASIDVGAASHALRVAKVYPDVRERQFTVDLNFTGEPPPGLRRGQTMRPRIELGETAQSLVMANGPFYDETGGVWVLVVSPNGSSASRRNVTLGRRNPEAVEVVAGLNAGERVITSSYQSFKDVDRIDLN